MNRMLPWIGVLALGTTLGCTGDEGGTDSGAPIPVPIETAPDLTITDEFEQTQFDAVNIIWVIDPEWSSALDPHRTAMDAFYEILLKHSVRWRVAVTTPLTDNELTRGELRNEHQTLPSPAGSPYGVFGYGPTNFRAAIEWTLTERVEEYPDFWFAGGHLSLISFADTPDQTPPGFIGREDFLDFLEKQDVVRTVGISAITVSSPPVRDAWREYADPTGGVVASASNPTSNLEAVALASLGLQTVFVLSEVPAAPPDTAILTYRGNQRRLFLGKDFDFDFQRNAIELRGEAPFAGTRIEVRYQRRVDGVQAPAAPATPTTPAPTSGTP